MRAAATDPMEPEETSWIEFPRLSGSGKQLMETAAAMMDRELGESIKPSETPPDVRSFQGANGEGSVVLRAGQERSKVSSRQILSVCYWINFFTTICDK